MRLTFFQKFLLLSLLAPISPSIASVTLPLSGIRKGEDAEVFTILTASPSGTIYKLARGFTLCDFAGTHIDAPGGAFRNLTGDLTFTGTTLFSSLTLRNISLGGLGAGVFSESALHFERLRKLVVENNVSKGGILTSNTSISFTKNVSLSFQNNNSSESGGAILLTGVRPGYLLFHAQKGCTAFMGNQANGFGGAINCNLTDSLVLFHENDSISFCGNQASSGGAIFNDGLVEFFGNKGSILFSDNKAENSGGAIFTHNCSIHKQEAPVTFTNNTAQTGGAIHTKRLLIKENDAPVLFNQNEASLYGGAVVAAEISINALHPVIFSNNSAAVNGGALYLDQPNPSLHLRAQEGDIVFSNNTVTVYSEKVHNAIASKYSMEEVHLSACSGHALIFYDPITTTSSSAVPVEINADPSSNGRVIFSGAMLSTTASQNKANKTSIFNQPVQLSHGVLSLEEGAVLVMQAFHQHGGLLNLCPAAELRAFNSDKGEFVFTNISFGFNPSESISNALVVSKNSKIKLSGSPQIYDPEGSLFYQNHRLASKEYQACIKFCSKEKIDNSQFELTPIHIEEGYGYQGSWTFNWEEDQRKCKTLKATWTPNGEFVLDPRREGKIVPSSLWGTAYSMQAAQEFMTGSYLLNQTLVPTGHCRLFGGAVASRIGRYVEHTDTVKSDKFGQNIGFCLPLAKEAVCCGALTRLQGTSKLDSASDVAQSDAWIASAAYARYGETISLHGFLSYAEETQVMRNPLGMASSLGLWKNYGMRGSVGVAYAYPKGIHYLKITPSVNIEYDLVSQNPFVETGHDPRYFSCSQLLNVAIPAGLTLEARLFSKHSSLFSKLSLTYTRDIKRKDPISSASLVANQHTWNITINPVGREALNLKFNTTFCYRCFAAYLGVSTSQREGNLISGNGFGGVSLTF